MNKHAYTEPMLYCARCAEYKYFSEVRVIDKRCDDYCEREVVQFVCPDCDHIVESFTIR